MSGFTGSYNAADTTFLLKPIEMEFVDVATKENLIQSGRHHYSEMISYETAPSEKYTRMFISLTARNKKRLASEIIGLARHIAAERKTSLSLVSLARAGTPIGALLARALRSLGRSDTRHYSISIIRDRGIDTNALRRIISHDRRPVDGIVFVDGWTGKGVIAGELKQALAAWNAANPERLDPRLYVLSDIGAVADVAATLDDYVIPSGIMNATVSGLVSRSILNGAVGDGDYHGCVYYRHLEPYDRTNWFLDTVSDEFDTAAVTRPLDETARTRRHTEARSFLDRVCADWGVADVNHVKPGIAEATRVLLRRVPEILLIKQLDDPDVAHLRLLAGERGVPVHPVADMPFAATALIKKVVNGAAAGMANFRSRGD